MSDVKEKNKLKKIRRAKRMGKLKKSNKHNNNKILLGCICILVFLTFLASAKPLNYFFVSSDKTIETWIISICNLTYMACGLNYILNKVSSYFNEVSKNETKQKI